MSEWGQCVTHHICDCKAEELKRLQTENAEVREYVGKTLQHGIRESILAEDTSTVAGRAHIAAFAASGYMVEKTTGVGYENPLRGEA